MTGLENATREIMWNISPAWLMYLLFAAALTVFIIGLYLRIQVWREGKGDGERFQHLLKRIFLVFRELLWQKRVRRSRFPGWFHSLIFYSFAVLIIVTAAVALDYDFGTNLFEGYLYVVLTVAAEVAGLFILVGVLMAVWRRHLKKPRTLETGAGDTWALVLLGGIVLTGFLVEGLRISVAGDRWAPLSPVGYAFSLMFTGVTPGSGKAVHAVLWWLHTVLAMGWIALIPYTKFFHLIALPANVFFSKLKPYGELRRQDLEAVMASEDFDEESFSVGVEKPADLTWKQRLDLDACISCGRCEEVCPIYLADMPFSPRQLISRLRAFMHASGNDDGSDDEAAIVDNALGEEYIWHCRTCTACMEACPALVEHVDTIIDIRRNEVTMKGRVPLEASRALKTLERKGNPFGPQSDKDEWISTLQAPVVGPGESCDVLCWIGCCTSFDPSKQKITEDLFTLLRACGIDFGILGADERCCGDPARLIGDENLFQTTAKQQMEVINRRRFKILLVSCPHCYNVLRHEYRQFGARYHVVHHTEFLHEMIWRGELLPQIPQSNRIVYHDPCYLGRYQGIYDSPREVLRSVPGARVLEMASHLDRSLCCGGGGGHYWMDIKGGVRINNLRVQQADQAGADTIVTGCPYCLQMLDDAVKLMNLDERIAVTDIVSYLLGAVGAEACDLSCGKRLVS